jgi:uncharacterized protein YjbJ (UPF0337 family)
MSLFHRSENAGDGAADRAQDQAEGRADQARDTAEGRADQARDTAEGRADQARDTAEDRADQARDTAEDRADQARDTAEDRAEHRADEARDGEGGAAATAAGASSYRGRVTELGLDRNTVLQRERERYGGVKAGSAFFGWLTATGTGVLLTALLTGAGAAVGVATNTDAGEAVTQATRNAGTIGIAGGIGLLCILFIAYYCGGYVAGRMARFNGASQGVAVWVIAVVIAVGIAVVGAIAGKQYDVLGSLNAFPRIPLGEGTLTGGGIAAALLAAVVSLAGAVVGGLAGVRYHRKVDRAGLGV